MTANLNPTLQGPTMQQLVEMPPLPRINKKSPTGFSQGGSKNIAQGVLQYLERTQSLRYQHLQDFDPNETDEQIEAKLKERFKMMRIQTRMAIRGMSRALVISGPGGVGKTYDVEKIITTWDPDGDMHDSSRGYVKGTHLFKLLWKHRRKGSVLVFDDSDSLFYEEKALNLIKVACDTTKKRVLTYGSEWKAVDENGEDIPKSFEFEGTIIFISNLDFDVMTDRGTKLAPHLEALMTRSNYINMGMRTKRDYLIRLFMAADEGLFDEMDMTDEQINDTLTFIDQNYTILRECSLRMGIKVANLRKMEDVMDPEDEDYMPWDRMAIISCCRTGAVPPPEIEDDEPDIVPDPDKAPEENNGHIDVDAEAAPVLAEEAAE